MAPFRTGAAERNQGWAGRSRRAAACARFAAVRWFAGLLLIALAAGCDETQAPEPGSGPSPETPESASAPAKRPDGVAAPEVDLAWRALDPLRSRIDEPRDGDQLDGPTTLWHAGGGKAGMREGGSGPEWTMQSSVIARMSATRAA